MLTRAVGVGLAMMTIACGDGSKVVGSEQRLVVPDAPPMTVLGLGAVRERYTAEVAARGSYAYTSTWGRRGIIPGDAVKVWDVRGATPLLVDSVIVGSSGTTGDVQVSDDGALLAVASQGGANGVFFYSLADPAHPQLAGFFTGPSVVLGGVHTVKFGRVGGRQYAFLSVNPTKSEAARLVILDLADPSSPQQVFAQDMGNPFIHDVFVRDGVLFTALWHEGVAIWDLGGAGRGGTPAAPVRLGTVRTVGGEAHNVWWYHDAAGGKRYAFVGQEGPGTYVGGGTTGDVHVIDVSSFDAPVEVAFFHVAGAGAHNFVMDEHRGILYAAFYNGGVRVLDVRGDLGSCTTAQRASDGRCDLGLMGREKGPALAPRNDVSVWGVSLVWPNLYASDMLNGLWKIAAYEN
jgi:hypothetical protein